MHVLAVGGAGDMGRAALRVVRDFPEVERITVADIDPGAAEAAAVEIGDKAWPLTLDVLDERAMAAAIGTAHAVLNSSGPFFRFGIPALKAAIAAGRPYFDICDDPEPTLGMLVLDRQAREAGMTAVVGIGASPGITNLLAVKAYRSLDSVTRLTTAWNVDGRVAAHEFRQPRQRASAAYTHWMQQITGDISVYENGSRNIRKPLEPIDLRFPGRGRRRAYRVGHPEAVTLGRNFRELFDAPNVMILGNALRLHLQALAARVNAGKLGIEAAAELLARGDGPGIGFGGMLRTLPGKLRRPLEMPELFALAEGEKDGRPACAAASVTAHPAYDMASLTGTPLAMALRLYIDGGMTEPGVHAPETAIDPDAFFTAYRAYCRVPETPAPTDEIVQITLA